MPSPNNRITGLVMVDAARARAEFSEGERLLREGNLLQGFRLFEARLISGDTGSYNAAAPASGWSRRRLAYSPGVIPLELTCFRDSSVL
jgi:hypothetical protein